MNPKQYAEAVANKCGARLTSVSDSGKTVAIEPVTIITLITTILPVIFGWVKQCRELRGNRDVQPSVVQHHGNPRTSGKQHKALCVRIKKCCRDGMQAEKRRAKQSGIPADLGRYQIDDASIERLADHSIAQMVSLPAAAAELLVASAGA
jgi:hypothetical protein